MTPELQKIIKGTTGVLKKGETVRKAAFVIRDNQYFAIGLDFTAEAQAELQIRSAAHRIGADSIIVVTPNSDESSIEFKFITPSSGFRLHGEVVKLSDLDQVTVDLGEEVKLTPADLQLHNYWS